MKRLFCTEHEIKKKDSFEYFDFNSFLKILSVVTYLH